MAVIKKIVCLFLMVTLPQKTITLHCMNNSSTVQTETEEVLVNQIDTRPENNINSETEILNDLEELKKYYIAINKIKKVLCKINGSGFRGWPTPNKFYWRTYKQIFLETHCFENGDEMLQRMYTPFGEVILLGSGNIRDLFNYSSLFLNRMKQRWNLKDVTQKIKVYNYDLMDSEKYGPWTLKKRLKNKALRKIYLIKSIDNIELLENENTNNELFFFRSVSLYGTNQYEKDKENFYILSGGRNHF